MKKENKIVIINTFIIICVTTLFIYFAIRGIDDLTGTYKIDETVKNTKELRKALEKYYQISGKYPDLTKKGANQNLYILDYEDKSGKTISFAEIYGRKTIAKTYGTETLEPSNKVYDIQNFDDATKDGGWNYNYSEQTGEIHPNLPDDVYREKINWKKQ